MVLRIKKKTDALKVVVPWDPAIDSKKSDIKKYLDTLEMSHLKFKAGKDPSIVHLNPNPQWVVAKLTNTTSLNIQRVMLQTFCYSVAKIENLGEHLLTDLVEIDGGTGVWNPEDEAEGPNDEKLPCVSEDDALTFFNFKFMSFISAITQTRSFLVPGTKRPFAQSLSSFLPTTEKKASS